MRKVQVTINVIMVADEAADSRLGTALLLFVF